jgi:hypothetical protein
MSASSRSRRAWLARTSAVAQMIGARRVHRGVAGEHADLLGPEDRDEREELLADQGLDRRGVPAALPLREGLRVRGDGHERLARAGRGREHDVGSTGEGEHRLLLRRVQGQALVAGPLDEDVEGRVRRGGPAGPPARGGAAGRGGGTGIRPGSGAVQSVGEGHRAPVSLSRAGGWSPRRGGRGRSAPHGRGPRTS